MLTLSANHGSTIPTCLACNTPKVTIVRLDKRVPQDIRPFLTPFPTQIEQLFAVAQFQYVGMMERIQYQESMINKLMLKTSKQKELLLLAKEKVSEIEGLEAQIQQLRHENNQLKDAAGRNSNDPYFQSRRPSTVDLTMDDSFESDNNVECPNRAEIYSRDSVSDTFIKQIKQNSSRKSSVNKPYVPPYSNPNQIRNFNQVQTAHVQSASPEFAKSKIAESTNIIHDHDSPLRRNIPIGSALNRVGSSNGSLSLSSKGQPYSNGSPNTSLTSSNNFVTPQTQVNKNQPRLLPLHEPPPRHSPPPSSNQPQQLSSSSNYLSGSRTSKQRASTSQIAQRLSAHMKIGSLQRSKSSRQQNGNSGVNMRPGSSFTSNRFRR